MSGAFGLAGWHFSRNPTSSSSENPVAKAPDSEPWKTGSDAKYQYHPGGDSSKPRKDAPSALNEVIVPNVNLPRVRRFSSCRNLHKSCIQLTCFTRIFTRSTTSGARRATRLPILASKLYRYLNPNVLSSVIPSFITACNIPTWSEHCTEYLLHIKIWSYQSSVYNTCLSEKCCSASMTRETHGRAAIAALLPAFSR